MGQCCADCRQTGCRRRAATVRLRLWWATACQTDPSDLQRRSLGRPCEPGCYNACIMSSERRMRTFRVTLVSVSAAAILALAACSRVADDWKAAQAADTTEAYQQFLKVHADSEFSTRAQDRVKQLAEERDWQQSSALDTRDAYEQFVAQHADGKWAQEARVRIENFKLAPSTDVAATAIANGGAAATAPAAADADVPAVAKPAAAQPAGKATASRPAPAPHAATTAVGAYAQLGPCSSKAGAQEDWLRLG